MLQLFGSGLLSLWLDLAGLSKAQVAPQEQSTSLINWLLLAGHDPASQQILEQYLQTLKQKGFAEAQQGLWVQGNDTLLTKHQGLTPLPAASLTKVATSLVALHAWGPNHQFIMQVGATGPIQNGTLQGDLVLQGSGDPFFVWEEAIALGNALNQLGIQRITGNVVITGAFAMNYETDVSIISPLLLMAWNAATWSEEVKGQYSTLPAGTPQPRIVVNGALKQATAPPANQTLLLRHRSLPLVQLLKQMNIYSNNEMANLLAASLGDGPTIAQRAATLAAFPPEEIQLINGSGLGPENQISPRGVCAMLRALHDYLQPYQLTIADVFPVAGYDRGTIKDRRMPPATAVKTGTLWDVSALAGVMPSRDRGPIWFAIINRGDGVEAFRMEQDRLLQALATQWGTPATLPEAFKPRSPIPQLGEAVRNELVATRQP